MKVNLRYIARDTDRHGNVRLYFRRNGRKIRLRGPEGSPIFLEDYRLAMLGQNPRQSNDVTLSRSNPGTIRELVELYYQSATFKSLAPRTRRVRSQILERFCLNKCDGDKPYAALEPRYLMLRRDAMMDRPEAANGMIKALRQVFEFAIDYGHHNSNPARAVKNLKSEGDGITAWQTEDVTSFEAVHPIGTTARLAMSLALFTGQRKSDLVRLGRQNVKVQDGCEWLHFTQRKNRDRQPVELWIPIAPELREIIDASPTGDLTFITSEFGRPFSEGGFGNRFRKWCNEANLQGLSVHGLRKTASAVLAENGCTEQEIMAITGHSTSKEVTRYTRSANQRIRAANAIEKMTGRDTAN